MLQRDQRAVWQHGTDHSNALCCAAVDGRSKLAKTREGVAGQSVACAHQQDGSRRLAVQRPCSGPAPLPPLTDMGLARFIHSDTFGHSLTHSPHSPRSSRSLTESECTAVPCRAAHYTRLVGWAWRVASRMAARGDTLTLYNPHGWPRLRARARRLGTLPIGTLLLRLSRSAQIIIGRCCP